MGKLDNRVVLVTGAGRGIGQAIALKMAQEGADVVVNVLDEEPAAETVAKIAALGRKAVPCVGNVAAPDFGDRLIKTALDTFGDFHIIVNNAGYTWDGVVQKMTDEQWYAILDCHLTAPFRIMRAAQPHIREASRREADNPVYRKVVNISSIAGLFGNAGQINYSSAKAALIGMTRTMCKEWGRYNVNVNCVAFGMIETRLTQPLTGKDAKITVEGRELDVGVQPSLIDTFKAMAPLGRPGTPEEAAGAVFLFTCPESDYVSGQIMVAGGGLLI